MFKELFKLAIDSNSSHEFCEKVFKTGYIVADAIDYLAKEGFDSLEDFYCYVKATIREEAAS
ncbi:hypothetical protein [Deferribacter abyssi]|uniref:hypothetical protein n=1 Tax=Deferribacter abyssi TaxID=213806 RepID=UPI003C272D5F